MRPKTYKKKRKLRPRKPPREFSPQAKIMTIAIKWALENNNYNRTKAAEELGLSLRTIRNYMNLPELRHLKVPSGGQGKIPFETILELLIKHEGYLVPVKLQTGMTISNIRARVRTAIKRGYTGIPPLRVTPKGTTMHNPMSTPKREVKTIHTEGFCGLCGKAFGIGKTACWYCMKPEDKETEAQIVEIKLNRGLVTAIEADLIRKKYKVYD